jgi:hypothetical protein
MMSNLIRQQSDIVKAAFILAGAAIIITLLILMYSSGVLQKGGWVFILFGVLIVYNLWHRLE